MSKDYKFNSELNKDWYTSENGNLYNSSLANTVINPGETKEVSYQVSVKEVEDNNQELTGEIKITADNYEEKTIQNITNKIETGNIKATIQFLYSEDIELYEKSDIPFAVNVKNISDKELEDVIVEIPVAEGLEVASREDLRTY